MGGEVRGLMSDGVAVNSAREGSEVGNAVKGRTEERARVECVEGDKEVASKLGGIGVCVGIGVVST